MISVSLSKAIVLEDYTAINPLSMPFVVFLMLLYLNFLSFKKVRKIMDPGLAPWTCGSNRVGLEFHLFGSNEYGQNEIFEIESRSTKIRS